MRSLLGVVWLVMALNILLSLATPVFIDGDREDYNVDLQDVEQEKHLDFPMTREFRINHFNEISFDEKVMRSTNCSSDQLSRGKRFWWLFKDRNRNRKSFHFNNWDRSRWGDKYGDNKYFY